MNGKDILVMVEVISNEKKIDKEMVFKSLERAFSVAARKDFGKFDLIVNIDRKTGLYEINRKVLVVDDNEENFDPLIHIYQDQAEEKYHKEVEIGEEIIEFVSSEPLSRIAAQVFKQAIKENIRRVQKEEWQKGYYSKKGQIINAVVKKFVTGDVVLSITEEIEGILPQAELIGYERFSIGQRIMVVLEKVVENYKGQQLIFSRASENFVIGLMKKEIPDVSDENIEIVSVARELGYKTKVVVKSIVPHLDPVRECLGHKGNRIKTISQEMNNEIVEVIGYEDNIVDYIISLIRPYNLISLYIDEMNSDIYVSVAEEDLGRVKGRDCLNEKLISKILEKNFKVVTEEELTDIENGSISNNSKIFQEALNVDEELADILVMEGFENIESVYYVDKEEMLEIEGFDEDLVEELKLAALNYMEFEKENAFVNFIDIGFTKEEASVLFDNEIKTIEDIADLSTYELLDRIDIEESKAASIIMTAREKCY